MGREIWNPDVADGMFPQTESHFPRKKACPGHASGPCYILLGHKDLETYGDLNQ